MRFARIPFILQTPDIGKIKGRLAKEYGTKTRMRYYQIADPEYFRSLHGYNPFTIMPNRVEYRETDCYGLLAAHSDLKSRVTLNYYVISGGCTTAFYEKKHENVPSVSVPSHTGKNDDVTFYQLEDLIKVDEFIAKDNEAYLLDVTKIHAVLSPVDKDQRALRKTISYVWENPEYDFDTILESINVVR